MGTTRRATWKYRLIVSILFLMCGCRLESHELPKPPAFQIVELTTTSELGYGLFGDISPDGHLIVCPYVGEFAVYEFGDLGVERQWSEPSLGAQVAFILDGKSLVKNLPPTLQVMDLSETDESFARVRTISVPQVDGQYFIGHLLAASPFSTFMLVYRGGTIVVFQDTGLLVELVRTWVSTSDNTRVMRSAALSPDGQRVAAVYGDGTVEVVDCGNGNRENFGPFLNLDGPLEWRRSGNQLLLASERGSILSLDLESKQVTTWRIRDDWEIKELVQSAGNSDELLVLIEGELVGLHSTTMDELFSIDISRYDAQTMRASRDGSRILLGALHSPNVVLIRSDKEIGDSYRKTR